jgi:hypothetical protein
MVAKVDGRSAPNTSYSRARGRLTVTLPTLAAGKHTLVLQVSDFQESKNMEDVARILPNTRTFRATFLTR